MNIAILDDYAGVALELADWRTLDADITVFRERINGEDELASRLEPYEVICLMRERTPMPASLIARLPNLRLIVTTGPRNAAIDVAAARARGIIVSGTESRKTAAAELAMTLLLALSRGLYAEAASVRSGGWQRFIGRELRDLTLGLVGLGHTGTQMAALSKAFGMHVIAWSENLTPSRCADAGVTYMATLQDLIAAADAISIHLVLSDRTRGLFAPASLASMKPDGMLVNTSRGEIVETHALLEALRTEPRRRAALDVFDVEPLPANHPLLDQTLIESGRLLLTPHIGYITEQNWRLFYGQTVDAIAAWSRGTPVREIA